MFSKLRCIDNRFIGLELIIDNRFTIENRFRIESLTSESESNRIVRCQEIPTPTGYHLHPLQQCGLPRAFQLSPYPNLVLPLCIELVTLQKGTCHVSIK